MRTNRNILPSKSNVVTDTDELPNVSNEQISFLSTFKLKRTLQNGSVDNNKMKKIKITENSNEKQYKVTNNDDIILIESDSDSDSSDDIIKISKKISQKLFPKLSKLFANKNLTFDSKREKEWKLKYEVLSKEVKEIATNLKNKELKKNIVAKSHLMPKNELNVHMSLNKELEHLPNIKIPSEEHNIEHEIINGDYHVIDITDYTEKSTSNSIKKTMSSLQGVKCIKLPSLSPSSSDCIVNLASSSFTPLTTASNIINKGVTKNARSFIINNLKSLATKPFARKLLHDSITDMDKLSTSQIIETLSPVPPALPIMFQHPAPLPGLPNQKNFVSCGKLPSAPNMTILKSSVPNVLILSCHMPHTEETVPDIIRYQIYSYHEIPYKAPKTELWKKIGDIKTCNLTMNYLLIDVTSGGIYHYAVRAVDINYRVGPFSLPQTPS